MRGRGARLAPAVAALALGTPAAAHAQAPSLATSTPQLLLGREAVLSGTAPAGTMVSLQASPYPYRAPVVVAMATAAPDGSFSFTVGPDRNTRYRAVVPTAASANVDVTVLYRVRRHARILPGGRLGVVVSLRRPADLRWGSLAVRWFLAARGSNRHSLIARTVSRDTGRGVTVLRAVLPTEGGAVVWSACVDAPRARRALGPASAWTCPRRGYSGFGRTDPRLSDRARLPAAYPAAASVARATAFARGRAGRVGFAVLDTFGRIRGWHATEHFPSMSVVKAMLLVADLRRLATDGRGLDAGTRALLYPMIHVSDNGAADAVFATVGQSGLARLGRAAGMTSLLTSADWKYTQITAADQVRFFAGQDALVPARFRGYARGLLAGIDPSQRWGIPPAVPGGFQVFFKGGWDDVRPPRIVNQVARLERGSERLALAVLTIGDPTMAYGEDTITGIAHRVLR